MSRIITASKLNRLWKNGVLNIKQTLEGLINTEKTERQAEVATERSRITALEETTGTILANKLTSYNDIMANEVEGYLPDALGVKEGFNKIPQIAFATEEPTEVPENTIVMVYEV